MARCELIRRFYDHPAITTDVIAGFPGETEEDFEISLAFVDAAKLYRMHLFPYSRREGTPAASMKGQLSMREKQERVDRLLEVDDRNSREFAEYYLGREIQVLTERTAELDGQTYFTGYTETYVPVLCPALEGEKTNQILRARAVSLFDGETLLCERI